MQTTGPTPLEQSEANARIVRMGMILGCSSLLLVLVVAGAMVTEFTDKYYKLFGYAIMIIAIFLLMVIIKNPKPSNVQRPREGSSFTSLQVTENLPYSTGPPTYSELLASDLINRDQNPSGVTESSHRHLEPPKNEPVAPPPSYDIAIGDSRDRIHSVCEVVPQSCPRESRRASDPMQQESSSVFPTTVGGRLDEGLPPSYEAAVSWMVDQEEQSTHDTQSLIT
ncbi:unnamed protein product [Meganyctiphanes norvegica]|uniref:Uncharacterized protein n=1 Tax=Meganyctiphanes norvegica TaxID=48144 RepID=A0AAV2S3K2_MEGNR